MPDEKQRPSPGRDWRDETYYDDLEQLDRRGFAWEYLRRNPSYRDEQESEDVLRSNLYQGVRVIIPSSGSTPPSWGLRFRRVTGPRRATRQGFLG